MEPGDGYSCSFCVCPPGLELCEPSLRLVGTMLAGLMTVAGELLLLAVALGCQTWRGLLGAGTAPLTLFLSYGYMSVCVWGCVELFLLVIWLFVLGVFWGGGTWKTRKEADGLLLVSWWKQTCWKLCWTILISIPSSHWAVWLLSEFINATFV